MKLVINIEPGWIYGTHTVEVDLDPDDFEGYTAEEKEREFAEIAQDEFHNQVSYGWIVVDD